MRTPICCLAIVALVLSGCATPRLPEGQTSQLVAQEVKPPYRLSDPTYAKDLADAEQKCQATYDALNDKVKASRRVNMDLLVIGIGLGLISGVVAAGNAAKIAKAFWATLATATTATATFAGTVNSSDKDAATQFATNYRSLDGAAKSDTEKDQAEADLASLKHLCDTGQPPVGAGGPAAGGAGK